MSGEGSSAQGSAPLPTHPHIRLAISMFNTVVGQSLVDDTRLRDAFLACQESMLTAHRAALAARGADADSDSDAGPTPQHVYDAYAVAVKEVVGEDRCVNLHLAWSA